MKRFNKFISLFFLGLVVLVILAGIFTQTPIFRNWLKDRAIEVLDASWNTRTTVRALHGNLFSYVQIEDLAINRKGGDFLKIKRARLRYSLWGILFKKIVVREVLLDEPEINWLPSDENPGKVLQLTDSADTTYAMPFPRFGWRLDAPNIQIRAGKATLKTKPAAFRVPSSIHGLDVDMGVWLADQRVRVVLENLNLETLNPDLSIRTLATDVDLDSSNLELNKLDIETKFSKLNSELSIKGFNNPVISFLLKGQPISFSEIRQFFPKLPFYGNPRITIEARGPLDDLQISCRFLSRPGLIEVGGTIQMSEVPYHYDLTGKASRFDLGKITNREDLKSNLNLRFRAAGQGLEWGRMRSTIAVELDSSDFYGVALNPSSLEATIRGDSVIFRLNAMADNALAKLDGAILYNPAHLGYRLTGQVRSLHAENFYPFANVSSDLDFDFTVQGSGEDLDTMTGKANINFLPSIINGVRVESARFGLQLDRGVLFLREFNINSPSGTISANGNVSLHKNNALTLKANLTDFSVFSAVLPVERIAGAGVFSARAEGPRDSLQVRTEFELDRVGINDILVDKFHGQGSGLLAPEELTFSFEGKAIDVTRSEIKLDAVDLNLNHANSISQFDVRLEQTDRLNVAAAGTFTTPADILASIDLTSLDVVYLQDMWHMSEKTKILIYDSRFAISDFNLVSGEQTFSVSGFFDTQAENELSAHVARFDIAKYDSLLGLSQELGGMVDADLKLAGTLAKPEVFVNLQVNNGKYLQTNFHRFGAELHYQPEKLTWGCVLSQTAGDSLMESSGHLPVALSFAPFKAQLLRDEQLIAKLSS
ncbi:MAG: hypothetical protein ACE5G1_03915, partial [bacterium]